MNSHVIIRCPECNSEAVYHYGKSHNGKERFICQVCERQFITDTKKLQIEKRPTCPACGKVMHVYMRNNDIIRFRCSGYPQCKTFLKDNPKDLNL